MCQRTRCVVWVMMFHFQCNKVRTRCWSVVIETNFRCKRHFLCLQKSVLLQFTIFSYSRINLFSEISVYKVSWRRETTPLLPPWVCPVVHSKQVNGSRSEVFISLLGFPFNSVSRLPPPWSFLLWWGWKWDESHLQKHTACALPRWHLRAQGRRVGITSHMHLEGIHPVSKCC